MLRALLSQLVCPGAGTPLYASRRWGASLSRLGAEPSRAPNPPCVQPLVAGIGRGVVRVVRARLAVKRKAGCEQHDLKPRLARGSTSPWYSPGTILD